MYPRYTYPWRTVFGLCRQALFGGQRSFRADGRACVGRLKPPMQVHGKACIPVRGPALVTANHWSRPGFCACWIPLAIASAVPEEMHWTVTGELTFPGVWYGVMGRPVSRWLLRRLQAVYGFTTMPPMPPRHPDAVARAQAVQHVLGHARRHPEAILGLAPEGMDMPGGVLAWPPAGVGRFISLLSGLGFTVTPVGIYEQDGALCLHFGQAYELRVPNGLGSADRDRIAARQVMDAIAHLVPPELRGEFA